MYNSIKYRDKYSKKIGSWQQEYRDEPAVSDANGNITNFPSNSALLKFKWKITGKTETNGTKNVNILVLFKYLSNFLKTLEVPLIHCEINLIITKLCYYNEIVLYLML